MNSIMLLRTIFLGSAVLLAGCGGDTKPLWYTKTELFTAPLPDQNDNIRVLNTYAQMKTTLISQDGELLSQQPFVGLAPQYPTLHTTSDDARNIYSYGVIQDGAATPVKNTLQVRKWDAVGNPVFHTGFDLSLADGLTVSLARYFDIGAGGRLVQLILTSGYPDYAPSQLLVSIDADGAKRAEQSVDTSTRIVAASAQRVLLQQNDGLVVRALPDLSPVRTLADAVLGGGSAPSKMQGVVTADNQFKLLVAQADRGLTPNSVVNDRVVLMTLDGEGDILASVPWLGEQSYSHFDTEDGLLRQFPLQHMVAMDNGDLAVAEPCRFEDGCDSNAVALVVASGEGALRWRKPVSLPSDLPLVYALANSDVFVRSSQRVDVSLTPVGLRYAQGKLWLLASSFSSGSGTETMQSLSQLWSFDATNGTQHRHLSTFKQTLDYTVASDDAIYVSHVGYLDGMTRSGVARYE